MSDQITFYHNPMSRGRIVHWMLEEIGAPYEIKILDFTKREHKTPAFLAINPMGKIPTIVHRGVVVTETAAICAYLADAFSEKKLAPALNDPKRGTYLRWFFFAAGCLETAVVDKMLTRPPTERTSAIGYGTYEDTIKAAETAVHPGPYILGDTFSAADLYLASSFAFGIMTKVIQATPVIKDYVARCNDRPSFQRFSEYYNQ